MRIAYHTFNAGSKKGKKSGARTSSLGFHNAILGYAVNEFEIVYWLGHETEFPGTMRIEYPVPPLCDVSRGHIFEPWAGCPEDVDVAVFRYMDIFHRRYSQLTAIWRYIKLGIPVVIFDGDAQFKSEQCLKELPRELKALERTWLCSTYPPDRAMHRQYFETHYPYQQELEMEWDEEAEAIVDAVYVGNCYERDSIHRWYSPQIAHEVWGYGWLKGETYKNRFRQEDVPGLCVMGFAQNPINTYRRGRYSIGVLRPIYEQWGMWTPRINEVTLAHRAFVWDPKLRDHGNMITPELLRKIKPERRRVLCERMRERLRPNTPADWWERLFNACL